MVRWIMACVTSASYSFSINGELTGHFNGAKGLRQGDHLSPFLFVICLDYFSRSLNMRTVNSEFNFHTKFHKGKITHLAFADDLLLFCRGDEGSVKIIKDCLTDFGKVSGRKANSLKSNIYLAGTTSMKSQRITDLLQFQKGEFPFKYLGVPMAASRLKVIQYSPLLESICSAISSWTASFLSFAGRLELIRAVIQGKTCYWLSMFNIPSAITYRIQRLYSIFLWGSKVARVSWENFCFPKSEGGIGLRKSENLEQSYSCKGAVEHSSEEGKSLDSMDPLFASNRE